MALCVAGCNNAYVQVTSGGPPPPPPSATASVHGTSGLGALYALGLISFATSGGTPFYAAPPMDPERRVAEQDCTKPIEEPGANLRCR